jgi:hypothetical protein
MRVAIHKPRRDPPPFAIGPLRRIPSGGQVLCRSGKGDAAVLRGYYAILDNPETVSVTGERGEASIKPDVVEAHADCSGISINVYT